MMSLRIKKRGGEDAPFNPQKIYNRIKRAAKGLNVNSENRAEVDKREVMEALIVDALRVSIWCCRSLIARACFLVRLGWNLVVFLR